MKTFLSTVTFLFCLQFLSAQNFPIAVNDTFSVPENVSTILPVTNNDADTGGGSLTVTILILPQHATVSVISGNQVIYTPSSFFLGVDSFTYAACDTFSLCDTAVVLINVSGPNYPPVAMDDNYTFGDMLNSVVLDALVNDHDPEGDSLFVRSVGYKDSVHALGIISINSREVVFTRNPLACGTDSFYYVLCDTISCDTGIISISILCPAAVFLPEGFSPDGDGKNDKLVFTGLEYFAPASLKVFNRYGTTVYENTDYQNNWDGTNFGGKTLPDGTYFYILQLPDKRSYVKYLIINR